MKPAFTFDRVRAFGWIVHRKLLAAGEQFRVNVAAAYEADRAPDVAVWTRGRVTGVDEWGGPVDDRLPGSSVLVRGHMRAGNFLMTAQEPSEFWCINRTINRDRLPNLEILDMAEGSAGILPHNALLCEGLMQVRGMSVRAPQAIAAGVPFVTDSRCIGFYFKE